MDRDVARFDRQHVSRLASYGTLAPGRQHHDQLTGLRGRWVPGFVLGRRITITWGASVGYPGLILDPAGEPVEVAVFLSGDLPAHWQRLDAFEGPDYRRTRVIVNIAGEKLPSCIYETVLTDSL
jgi:gamma-glutamylcyclotransferase (GGCT)/AIG2-like uncharacterized protein YtfP